MIALPQLAGHNLLTHSRLSCMAECPRKHYYRYELGIRRSRTAQPLRMGGAFHLGLDLRAQGRAVDEAVAEAIAEYAVLPEWCRTDEQVADWLCEREKVATLLFGYFHYWEVQRCREHEPTDPVEIIATEQQFEIPLRNPDTGKASRNFRLAGKIDKIVRLRDGRLAVMEHKTAKADLAPHSNYWKRLEIDQQISIYMIAARTIGYPVETVLYDVIRKPGIKPRTAVPTLDENGLKIVINIHTGERVYGKRGKNGQPPAPRQTGSSEEGYVLQTHKETVEEYGARLAADIDSKPGWYFARKEIPRLRVDLDETEAELWHLQQEIRDRQKSKRWRRNASSCLRYNKAEPDSDGEDGACEYLPVCKNGLEYGRVPDGFVQVENVHGELDTDDESEAA